MSAILTHAEVEAALVAATASLYQPGAILGFGEPYTWAMEKAAMAAIGPIVICDAVALHDYLDAQDIALIDVEEERSPRRAALQAGSGALMRFLVFARNLSRDDALTRGMFLLRCLHDNPQGAIVPAAWRDTALDSIADDLRTLGKGV